MIDSFLASAWVRAVAGLVTIGFLLMQIASYRTENASLDASIGSTEGQILRLSTALGRRNEDQTYSFAEDLPWKTTDRTSVEQSLQNWALNRLQTGGQTIRQYALAPQLPGIDAPTVALRLEFTGSLSGLTEFVAELEAHRPALAISSLQMRPLPQREQRAGSTTVSVQMVIWGVATDD